MSQFPGQAAQPQWQWSHRMQQYYIYDHRRASYVLQNGRSVTASEVGAASASSSATGIARNPAPHHTSAAGHYVGAGAAQYAPMGGPSAHASPAARQVARAPWVQDAVPQYRLTKALVERFLEKVFGRNNYNVQLYQDQFVFQAPRRLKEEEQDELTEMRA